MVQTPPGKILDATSDAALRTAAKILSEGGVVAFPTETVYGLGADGFNEKAVCRIFEIKKRPSFDPLILHVFEPAQVRSLWKTVPPLAAALIKKFWPGPLTLVLPKKEAVPDVVTAGLGTVAVRMPRNEAALKLIGYLGRPIAAPSANLYGCTSPTTAEAVREDLGDKLDLILDGGPAAVGLESTVLKIEGNTGVLLRPGGISVEEIEKFAPVVRAKPTAEEIRESPGLLKTHYAPRTPFVFFEGTTEELARDFDAAKKKLKKKDQALPRIVLLSFGKQTAPAFIEAVEVLSVKRDLTEAAANLFQAIRKLDKMHADLIVALKVPEHGIGLAILDRLRKAGGGQKGLKDFLEKWDP